MKLIKNWFRITEEFNVKSENWIDAPQTTITYLLIQPNHAPKTILYPGIKQEPQSWRGSALSPGLAVNSCNGTQNHRDWFSPTPKLTALGKAWATDKKFRLLALIMLLSEHCITKGHNHPHSSACCHCSDTGPSTEDAGWSFLSRKHPSTRGCPCILRVSQWWDGDHHCSTVALLFRDRAPLPGQTAPVTALLIFAQTWHQSSQELKNNLPISCLPGFLPWTTATAGS